ncbi:transposase [Sulfitobacter mediterraneus]|uniref:transposase n=1 Tax=Sulfitobacter mediterraneus TaxID=83219 RepID=UPI0031B61BFE
MCARLEKVHNLTLSADLVSHGTDAVLAEVYDCQNRALAPAYSIVLLDALRVKIRYAESRLVRNRAVFVTLGVTPDVIVRLPYKSIFVTHRRPE